MIFYITLSIIFTLFGLLYTSNRKPFAFLILAIVVPFTTQLFPLHTKFQISAYYFFLVYPLSMSLLSFMKKVKIEKSRLYHLLLGMFSIIFFLLLSVFFLGCKPEIVNIMKDLNPLVAILIIGVLFEIPERKRLMWKSDQTITLLIINCCASVFYYVLFSKTDLIIALNDDPLMKFTDFRYASLGTIFALFYFLFKMSNKSAIKWWEFLLIFLPIFLSGNRTYFIVVLVIFIIDFLRSFQTLKSLSRKILIIPIASFGVIGVFTFNKNLRERILSLFDMNIVTSQFFNYRLKPFIMKIEDYEWYNYIIGKGMGSTFFIPWFVWRKNIDNYNIYMDNLYLTLYMKYGVLMILPIILLINYIRINVKNNMFFTYLLIYFAIMSITTSFMYQNHFIFTLLLLALFNNSSISTQNTEKKDN